MLACNGYFTSQFRPVAGTVSGTGWFNYYTYPSNQRSEKMALERGQDYLLVSEFAESDGNDYINVRYVFTSLTLSSSIQTIIKVLLAPILCYNTSHRCIYLSICLISLNVITSSIYTLSLSLSLFSLSLLLAGGSSDARHAVHTLSDTAIKQRETTDISLYNWTL